MHIAHCCADVSSVTPRRTAEAKFCNNRSFARHSRLNGNVPWNRVTLCDILKVVSRFSSTTLNEVHHFKSSCLCAIQQKNLCDMQRVEKWEQWMISDFITIYELKFHLKTLILIKHFKKIGYILEIICSVDR